MQQNNEVSFQDGLTHWLLLEYSAEKRICTGFYPPRKNSGFCVCY